MFRDVSAVKRVMLLACIMVALAAIPASLHAAGGPGGNGPGAVVSATTTDTPSPSIPVPSLDVSTGIINIQNQGSVVATGTVAAAPAGFNVEIYFRDAESREVTRTATIDTNGAFSTTADLSSLKDGSIFIRAVLVDVASNYGDFSPLLVRVKDTVPPPAPTFNTLSNIGPGNMAAYTVSGTALAGTSLTVRASDGTREATATINPVNNGAFSSPLNLSAFSSGTVTITARVVNTAGNGSATTTAQVIKDVTAPSTASSVSARALSNSDLFVSWTAATDGGSGISHYEVILNSSTPIVVNGTSYSFRPANNTVYAIVVRAHDKAGNTATASTIQARSQSSSSVTAPEGGNVTVSLRAGSGYSPVSLTFSNVSGSNRTVSVTAASSHSAAVPAGFTVMGAYYNISLSSGSWYGGNVKVVLPYSDSNMTLEQEQALRLYHYKSGWRHITTSVDTSNNLIIGTTNDFSVFAVFIDNANAAKINDSVAPAAPRNPRVVSTKGLIQLDWTANTESDFSHYNVYRRLKNSTTYARLNTSSLTATGYQDKSAALGVDYVYYITAVDKAGNESVKSNLVEAYIAITYASLAFSDVPANAWFEAAVTKLASRQIIGGYAGGIFGPNLNVTRAEFAKMLCLTMGWQLEYPAGNSFTDVGSAHWARSYIETARRHGVIDGYPNGIFKPSGNITRAEIAKMMSQALGLPSGSSSFSDIDSSWARDHIAACVGAGIITGYPGNLFRPDKLATRAEGAVIIATQVKD